MSTLPGQSIPRLEDVPLLRDPSAAYPVLHKGITGHPPWDEAPS